MRDYAAAATECWSSIHWPEDLSTAKLIWEMCWAISVVNPGKSVAGRAEPSVTSQTYGASSAFGIKPS